MAINNSMQCGQNFHYYMSRVENVLQRVDESSICKQNKALIRKYYRLYAASGRKPYSCLTHLNCIRIIGEYLPGKKFRAWTRDDVLKVIEKIKKERDLGRWGLKNYLLTFKCFWKFLNDFKGYPPQVSWINTKFGAVHAPKNLLTRRDIFVLLNLCDSSMERALLAVAFDSALRPKELLSRTVGDLERIGNYIVIHTQGKITYSRKEVEERAVPIKFSIPFLEAWLKEHPCPRNPVAPLWGISYVTVRRFLGKLRERAQLKRLSLYDLRKARLTELGEMGANEYFLDNFAGMVYGSTQTRHYLQRAGIGIIEMYDRLMKYCPSNNTTFDVKRLKNTSIF